MFALFKGKRAELHAAHALYCAIVAQARQPVFYERCGVPDSVDGRFDMICLHVFLVMERLLGEGRQGKILAQKLFDTMFRDMERNLREIGVGDLSLPKHVKRMMKGFNGRASAYHQALKSGALDEVLRRNLYGTVKQPDEGHIAAMTQYIDDNAALLARQSYALIAAGQVEFAPFTGQKDESDDKRNAESRMVA
ncbi:MAG: ubiquinol-cytochrome C chaperone family protein [Rhodospirillales bacterium]|nr:ubiquinol-cytochrome C chaperone family protein [Rhodospirillales bacterium]MCB9995513.1 ubiquinol-cytochrome C chaperone family protein [Rhodospirillales bacterium]